jgi:hypothetical protein
MNGKRLIAAGLAASLLFLVMDALFGVLSGFMGATVFGIPATQPPMPKQTLGLLFELINGFMLAVIYAIVHPALPGQGWTKGLSFGLIVWGLRVVMWAFTTFMLTDMAPIMIGLAVFTGLIEMLIICVVIAAIYRDNETGRDKA